VAARAGLTPAAVVATAADLADANGLESLTLAAVAGAAGVRTPSLYNHVAGLEDLRRRLALHALEEMDAALRAAVMGRAGDDALTALAHAYRDYARRHPGRYAATVRAPDPADADLAAAGASAVEPLFAALRGYGLAGDELVHAARAVRSALHGFVALEGAGGFGLPVALDESFDAMVAALARGLAAPEDRLSGSDPAGRS
jgi:AcrR family transcriptional regulator